MADAKYLACAVAAACVLPAAAEEQRSVDAHEHGHGILNIAIEGDRIAMELEVPGFDIVGFEHAAESDADRATVDAALEKLAEPLELFAMPDAAECGVVESQAILIFDGEHHDDHEDSHDHEDEDEHHDDHGHDEDEEATHSEFHAEYLLACGDIGSATQIEMRFFDSFSNSESLTVQIVTAQGATLIEATRENSTLDLSSWIQN